MIGVITPFVSRRGPPCRAYTNLVEFYLFKLAIDTSMISPADLRSYHKWCCMQNHRFGYGLGPMSAEKCHPTRISMLNGLFHPFLSSLWTNLLTSYSLAVLLSYPPWNYMGVSENGGTPKSSILIGMFITNHPFWGTPIFWKHPYNSKSSENQWLEDENSLWDNLVSWSMLFSGKCWNWSLPYIEEVWRNPQHISWKKTAFRGSFDTFFVTKKILYRKVSSEASRLGVLDLRRGKASSTSL